jgi:hypothetical protein
VQHHGEDKDQQDDQQDDAGLGLLRHRINIVIRQHEHRHQRARARDRRHGHREHGQVAPRLGRSWFGIQSPKKHFEREQEQDESACHFERVHTNPNGVENNLSRYHRDDQDNSGVEGSAQRGAVPFRPCQRCGQPGKNRHIPDRIDRVANGAEGSAT